MSKRSVLRVSRQRSWLGFNGRVLLQATRQDFPLLERLRFLAIHGNNSDELFSARLHPLQQEAKAAAANSALRREYNALVAEAGLQLSTSAKLLKSLLQELARQGLHLIEPEGFTADEAAYFGAFLAETVSPLTDPISIESLGLADSRALYLAAGDAQLRFFVRVPDALPRLVRVPGRVGAFVRLEALMRWRSDLFLPAPLALFAFRVTRRANIELHGQVDWDELAHALESRLDGVVARLEVERGFPWVAALQGVFGLDTPEVFLCDAPLDLRFLEALCNLDRPKLRFAPALRRRKQFSSDPFPRLRKGDVALYHPRDDYQGVVDFLGVAAKDSRVTGLRATLYRLGQQSVVAESLIEAAQRGKDVAVFLEGRARFDELSNFYWSLRFKEAGVRVLPYPPNLKVHAKALLVTRRDRGYLHLGTGNYNVVTGRLYTDLSLFTARENLVADAHEFFLALEEARAPKLRHMRVGVAARDTMIAHILEEANPKGHIILKLNHLTDESVLAALVQAAEAGAKVDLVVRSSITLIHPRFRVRSLVGRFLEHARIAAFKRGGKWAVWAGSADWMTRNFERRLELIFPVVENEARLGVLKLLKSQLQDDVNAFRLGSDGGAKALWGGSRDSQLERL